MSRSSQNGLQSWNLLAARQSLHREIGDIAPEQLVTERGAVGMAVHHSAGSHGNNSKLVGFWNKADLGFRSQRSWKQTALLVCLGDL